MPSFHEKPRATNPALYPMMFPSTAWWNYELSFMYQYFILDIIFLEPVFPFFLEGSASMISLHLSYYFSSWTVITCSLEQVSSFFSCRWLYTIFLLIKLSLMPTVPGHSCRQLSLRALVKTLMPTFEIEEVKEPILWPSGSDVANRHMEDLGHYIWWPSLLVNIVEALFASYTSNVDNEIFEGWKRLYDNKSLIHGGQTKEKLTKYEIQYGKESKVPKSAVLVFHFSLE